MLTNKELYQCMIEAEQRKSDNDLPMDVRIRSMETFTICLHISMKSVLE